MFATVRGTRGPGHEGAKDWSGSSRSAASAAPAAACSWACEDGRLVALRGDPEHPTTKGLVCAKALFLPKIVYSEDRLKNPLIRKDGKLVRRHPGTRR